MAPIQIQTSKPISTSQRSPTSSQPPSQQPSRAPSPTRTAAKPPPSPTTLAPPPASGPSAAASRYAPASPTSTTPATSMYPSAQPGAAVGSAPTGTALPPPPRSPTRTTQPFSPPTQEGPPPPQPGAAPVPKTAPSFLSGQPGGGPPPPQPGPAPSLSHPPGYQQNPHAGTSTGGTVAAPNTSMGMGSLTPLSISRNPSPGPTGRLQNQGAGLPDPGAGGGMLNGVLPDGTAEQAGQAWTAVKGWVGSTASTVGKKAIEVEGQVWKKVNGE